MTHECARCGLPGIIYRGITLCADCRLVLTRREVRAWA